MRVLWLCNIVLPVIARELGMEVSNKEGWISGMADTLLKKKGGKRHRAVCCISCRGRGDSGREKDRRFNLLRIQGGSAPGGNL